ARPIDRWKHVAGGALRVLAGEMQRVSPLRQREHDLPTPDAAETNVDQLPSLERDDVAATRVAVRHSRDDRIRAAIGNSPVAGIDASPDPPAAPSETDSGANA